MSDATFDFFAVIFDQDKKDRAQLALARLDPPRMVKRTRAIRADAYQPTLLSKFGIRAALGKTTVQNGSTVSHGLSAAPDYVIVTPTVAKRICCVTATAATTFTVSLHDDTGSAIGSPGEDVYWLAFGDKSTPPDYQSL